MTWLLWRQHRLQGAIATVVFGGFFVALLLTGWHMADLYRSAVATCRPNGTCDDLNLFQGYGAIVDVVNLSVVVPLLVGVFWGATVLGREFDAGTHILVWTQSVSRRRWQSHKISLLLVGTVVFSAAVAATATWWSGTPNSYYGDRFTPSKFDVQGIVPVAYALFAAGLGLAAAAVLRRTLAAIAVTVGGFLAVRIVVSNWLRPNFQAARVLDVPADQKVPTQSGSWVLHEDFVLHGRVVNGSLAAPVQCVGPVDRGNGRECLASLGYRYVVHYQPADRYWTFQAYEAAIFVALAIGLVLTAWLVTRRRDA